MKSFILICLCLVTYVCAQQPTPISATFFGSAGNGTIYYQSPQNYFTFSGNVQNPIDVSISYQQNVFNFEASVCLNYNGLPINGASLSSACPVGGYGTASNTTSYLVAPPNNQVQKTQYSSLKSRFIGNKMAMASSPLPEGTTTETTIAKVYVKPGRAGGFVVTVPDSVDSVYFYVGYSGFQCDPADGYAINGSCVTIPPAVLGYNYIQGVLADSWAYYQLSVNAFSNGLSGFNVSINGTKDDVKLYVQSGYYPTQDWFINTINDDDDGTLTAVIANPANTYINANETFFFGVYNDNKNAQSVNLTITTETCDATTFGYRCSHLIAPTNVTDPVGGYAFLNATLIPGNNITTLSFDYTDKDKYSDYDYAYFMLTGYPTKNTPGFEGLTYPYYIRVTVANNDVSEYAPAFYAKQGGFPSAQSATYNLSTTTDITHQIVIRVDDPVAEDPGTTPGAKAWFFAVQLKADFSIWVGANCANCDSEHGACKCNGALCNTTTNIENYVAFYTLPNSTEDSGGACTCDDDDYDYSFDCSQKNNGNAALYIVLIAVGGMIVLAVAIGVPIYCYISNKKATRYDRM